MRTTHNIEINVLPKLAAPSILIKFFMVNMLVKLYAYAHAFMLIQNKKFLKNV